jgi:hypothetical protein
VETGNFCAEIAETCAGIAGFCGEITDFYKEIVETCAGIADFCTGMVNFCAGIADTGAEIVHFHAAICRLQTGFSAENLHFIKKNAVSGTGVLQIVAKWRSFAVVGKNTVRFSSGERGNGDLCCLPAALSLRICRVKSSIRVRRMASSCGFGMTGGTS